MLEWFGRLSLVYCYIYCFCWLFDTGATVPQIVIYSYVFYVIFEDSLE